MPYSTNNPPRLTDQDIGNQGPARWEYTNVDAVAAVRVNGYITNAKALGMKVGDRVAYTKTDVLPMPVQTMAVVAINANGSADLGDGSALVVTNTD